MPPDSDRLRYRVRIFAGPGLPYCRVLGRDEYFWHRLYEKQVSAYYIYIFPSCIDLQPVMYERNIKKQHHNTSKNNGHKLDAKIYRNSSI